MTRQDYIIVGLMVCLCGCGHTYEQIRKAELRRLEESGTLDQYEKELDEAIVKQEAETAVLLAKERRRIFGNRKSAEVSE